MEIAIWFQIDFLFQMENKVCFKIAEVFLIELYFLLIYHLECTYFWFSCKETRTGIDSPSCDWKRGERYLSLYATPYTERQTASFFISSLGGEWSWGFPLFSALVRQINNAIRLSSSIRLQLNRYLNGLTAALTSWQHPLKLPTIAYFFLPLRQRQR